MAGVAVVKQPARALVAKHGARHDDVGILDEKLTEVNGRAAAGPGDMCGQRDGLLLPDMAAEDTTTVDRTLDPGGAAGPGRAHTPGTPACGAAAHYLLFFL